jgi:glutaredoxin
MYHLLVTSWPQATLYVRAGCHLCEQAEAIVRRLPCSLTVVDVDTSPDLQTCFGEKVPVLVVGGEAVLSGDIREGAARRALQLDGRL